MVEGGSSLKEIATTAYTDQKPGTSGLRKKVIVFQQPNYVANFTQSIFNALEKAEYIGKYLLIGGDGRYYNHEAIKIIMQVAAGNECKGVYLTPRGWISTPGISAIIRMTNEESPGVIFGGVILTASHNPGGPEHDFGMKFNTQNGAPSVEGITNAIFEASKQLKSYKIYDFEVPDELIAGDEAYKSKVLPLDVKMVNGVEIYTKLMQSIFDFPKIKQFIARKDFRMIFDGMSGIAGPYAKHILGTCLGVNADDLQFCDPLIDFGGCHPDPNLTYATNLVKLMGLKQGDVPIAIPDLGGACDGDADRNMIIGKQFFVTPSDSVAIIAANYNSIPYFKEGLKGLARSMPTSKAIDSVAKKLGVELYEVPTGWKFFGNLMDAGKLSICGEESFGTGSDHIREKDGLWAVLAWLSILAQKNTDTEEGKLVSIEDIVKCFWMEYGRCYYSRYDYEELKTEEAEALMKHLESMQQSFRDSAPGNSADNFSYTDPIDSSLSVEQGLRFMYADGSRFVVRISRTSASGATIRIYVEKYEKDQIGEDAQVALKDIREDALKYSDMFALTGRDKPTVTT